MGGRQMVWGPRVRTSGFIVFSSKDLVYHVLGCGIICTLFGSSPHITVQPLPGPPSQPRPHTSEPLPPAVPSARLHSG